MRLIHTSDLHLDSKMTAHLPLDKARQRRKELLLAFQKMLKFASENQVDAILIAGDLFDTNNISALAENTVLDGIRSNPQITFYYLKGNHDRDGFLSRQESIPKNLKMFEDTWTYYENEIGQDKKLVIAGMERNPYNSFELTDGLRLEEENVNIVILHGQEVNSAVKENGDFIHLKALQNRGIDYLALGHIHRYKEGRLDARGIYCYSGCLEARGFDEVGEHGFVLLEINERTGELQHCFILQAERSFHERELDVSGCQTTAQIGERIEDFLRKEDIPEEDMLKLVLTGEIDVEAEKDLEMLNQQWKDRFYFCKIYDQTKWRIEMDSYQEELSLRGEFVRMVKMDSSLPGEEKAEIIQVGLMLFRGEKIE